MKVTFETLGNYRYLFLIPKDEWKETSNPNEYLILEIRDIEPRESKYFNVKGYPFKIIQESGKRMGLFYGNFFLTQNDLHNFKKIKGYQNLDKLMQEYFDYVL